MTPLRVSLLPLLLVLLTVVQARLSLAVENVGRQQQVVNSRKTMRKICEMPEFQEAMAADEGNEIVY